MLDANRLKEKIMSAFQDEQDTQENAQAALERISGKIAAACIEEIKELKINYTTGLTAAYGGPVTGTMTYTIT